MTRLHLRYRSAKTTHDERRWICLIIFRTDDSTGCFNRRIVGQPLRGVDVALAISNLSAYHIAFGRWPDARIHAREAVEAAREARQYIEVARMLQHLGAIAALSPAPQSESSARKEVAALLFGYVDVFSTRVGASRTAVERQEYERALTALRETLYCDQLEELMVNGSRLTLNEAIAFALSV